MPPFSEAPASCSRGQMAIAETKLVFRVQELDLAIFGPASFSSE